MNSATVNSAQYLYGGFSCRDTLEGAIDILRDEGFKSQDLEVLVGVTAVSNASEPSSRWFAGIPATTTPQGISKHTGWFNLLPLKIVRKTNPIAEYLAHGGLLLSITTWSNKDREIALEVLEDAGATCIQDTPRISAILPKLFMLRQTQHSSPYAFR